LLPSALISQLEQGMRDFLRVSFWSSSPGFQDMLDRFIAGEDEDVQSSDSAYRDSPIFRGPFVSMDLPFEHGDVGPDYFDDVPMAFPPYRHQQQAFDRLSGPDRQNTVVATGTGSGKTETFLFPILAHCLNRQSRDGIKAILIYPMNALANDQQQRFAETIYDNDALKNRVTAGMYIGQSERVPRAGMGEDHVITDKDQLRSTPPDILLTNYKMLDYLLARPRDQDLWRHNDPETLQFLITDELHTFDGAQGTDLACLIRRLKSRLNTPDDHLTCVATSATLGGEGDHGELTDFAESIFGEAFDADSIVHESRVDTRDFRDVLLGEDKSPEPDDVAELNPVNFQDNDAYLQRQQQLWFGETYDRAELGEELRKNPIFHNLIKFVGNTTLPLGQLVYKFRNHVALPSDERNYTRNAILSLIALASHARREVSRQQLPGDTDTQQADNAEPLRQPLVQVQIQFWQREMRRMVASVEDTPSLRFYDDLTRDQHDGHLPTIYCRECGLMGWATKREEDAPTDATINLKDFYRSFFSSDPRVDFIFKQDPDLELVGQYAGGDADHRDYTLDTGTLSLHPGELDDEDAQGETLEVVVSDNTVDTNRGPKLHRHCPQCDSHDSLSLLGFQAATLTSAFINHLYASRFNDDKKLLTFSDSVQDASHRAGFFGARTWRFNLRIAIQQVLRSADDSVGLHDLTDLVVDTWRDRLGDEEFVGTFIAPDMRWLDDYEHLTEHDELPDGSNLINLIRRRLSWEIHTEFSFQAPIGRSLSKTGAAAAYVEPDAIDDAVERALPELQNQIGGFRNVTKPQLRRMLLGLTHHLLERGALYQPQLHETYLESGGKNTFVMSQKRHYLPSFSPHSRLPAFLASRSTRRFDPLTYKTKQSWYERWLTRTLLADDSLSADQPEYVYDIILDALIDAGVLEKRHYGGTHVWGLQPHAIRVTPDVTPVRHANTNQTRYVATTESDDWDGMPAPSPVNTSPTHPTPAPTITTTSTVRATSVASSPPNTPACSTATNARTSKPTSNPTLPSPGTQICSPVRPPSRWASTSATSRPSFCARSHPLEPTTSSASAAQAAPTATHSSSHSPRRVPTTCTSSPSLAR